MSETRLAWRHRAPLRSALRVRAGVVACLLSVAVAGCGSDDGPTVDPTRDAATAPTTDPATEITDRPTVEASPVPPSTPTTSEPTAEPTPAVPATPTEDTRMTTSPEPAPEVITEAHDGRSISLSVGDEVPLQLDSAWFWDPPAVNGHAIELIQVDYFTDPGYMEWIVTGIRPGDAVVSANGEPNCDDESRCPPTAVRIAFHVTD